MKSKVITLVWILAAFVWIFNYYQLSDKYQQLKANPIHDTVSVVNEANDYIKVKTSETDTVLIPVYKIKKK